MARLLRDARFAFRLFSKAPAFTSLAVGVLALGISSTTAIFSVVYGTFFAPLPYRDPEALVMVWSQFRGERVPVSAKDYVVWKREATAFDDLNAWGGRSVNMATADRPENVQAGVATPGFLAMLGYGHPLALGRSFIEDEGTVGRDRVVILTYRVWRDRFGGDPAIVGRQIRLDNEPYTVVGVLGEGPADHQQSKLWLPLAFTPEQLTSDSHSLNVMGRLRRGVTIQQANANMAALGTAVEQRTSRPDDTWRTSVEPFRNNFVRSSTKQGLWLLLAAVCFLLLIACANVANLLLARGSVRQRELAIRSALGATNGAIARQLLIESLVLAFAGGAVGALFASIQLDAIVALMPEYTLPSETEITLSVPVLLFALGVCAMAGVLAGCAPAWQAARANLADAIKEGGRSIASGRNLLRRALVVMEFALALTLLAGGGLAAHAFIRTMSVDLGFRTDHLLTLQLPVPRGRFTTPEEVEIFYRQLLDRTAAIPGVTSASISTGMPPQGTSFGRAFEIVGRPTRSGQANRRRREHGDAAVLRDARDSDSSRPGLHRAGSRRRRARGDRQRDVRQGISAGCGPADAARPHAAVRLWHRAARARIRRVADRRRVRRGEERRPDQPQLPRNRSALLAGPVAAHDAGRAHGRGPTGACSRPWRTSSRRSSPICRWPTCGRWSRSSASPWRQTASTRSCLPPSRPSRSFWLPWASTASCLSSWRSARRRSACAWRSAPPRARVLHEVLREGHDHGAHRHHPRCRRRLVHRRWR